MCLICIDFQKGTLTTTEAWRNLQEMKEALPDEHYDEVVTMVIDKLYEEQIEADDEIELVSLLENLEEDGQLSFGWDEPEAAGFNDEIDNPWYIPPYED